MNMGNNFEIWSPIVKFRSIKFTQQFLYHCYEQKMFQEAEKFAYQNCYPFLYYLDYGEKYFKQADNAPMELQPILIFYGFIQLLKACILTEDPHYPASSQVLAHGVSTRKRKKANYIFLEDEVKIQKNGLLAHFSDKLFHVKHFPGEKYKMRQLMRQISELHSLFTMIENKKEKYELHTLSATTYLVDENILNDYQLGLSSFTSFLLARSNFITAIVENDGHLRLELKKPLKRYNCSPFMFDCNGRFYISPYREELTELPEVIIHYLILYNLSMICRYETEWWGELFHYNSEYDFPFIETFLKISLKKIPCLLFTFLNDKMK